MYAALGLDVALAPRRFTISALAGRVAASLTREWDLLTQGCLRVTGAAVRDRNPREMRRAAGVPR